MSASRTRNSSYALAATDALRKSYSYFCINVVLSEECKDKRRMQFYVISHENLSDRPYF